MQDPLKQGLKLNRINVIRIVFLIRMQDPLKQGLKLDYSVAFETDTPYSNARSTKTRIETI